MCVVCVRVCLCVCACVRAATEATLEEAPAAAVRGAGRRKKGVDCFAKGLFCVFEAAFIHALLVRACMISQESHCDRFATLWGENFRSSLLVKSLSWKSL